MGEELQGGLRRGDFSEQSQRIHCETWRQLCHRVKANEAPSPGFNLPLSKVGSAPHSARAPSSLAWQRSPPIPATQAEGPEQMGQHKEEARHISPLPQVAPVSQRSKERFPRGQ